MARALETAASTDVMKALAAWETERAQLAAKQELPAPQTGKPAALLIVLEVEKGIICASIVNTIAANSFATRMKLNDTSPSIKEFFKGVYRDRDIIDALRSWFEKTFEGRIRVEGDPDSTGYYLDFA